MTNRSTIVAFISWFIVGTTVAGTVQFLRAEASGGAAGLVNAGRLEPAHVVVTDELPAAPLAEDHGHDGQIFFAIGVDPFAEETPPSIVPSYRYRRVLYPALAGIFGMLGGSSLLWGMIALASASVGIAAGSLAAIATERQIGWLAPLTVVLNPGLWLSAMFLTADNLAFAFALLGLWAFTNRRDHWCLVALVAAALTKETHIAFAVGMAAFLFARGERDRSLRFLLVPLLPIGLWTAFLAIRMGNPFDSGDNLAAPFSGILESVAVWSSVGGIELAFTVLTLAGMVLCLATILFRRHLISWIAAPWLLIGILSSHYVWDLGNNSLRTLAPLLTLGILGVATEARHWSGSSAEPSPASSPPG